MNRFSNILFVADSGAEDTAAFGQALTLANNNQTNITVAGLIEMPSGAPDSDELLGAMVEQRRQQLQALVQSAAITGPEIKIIVLVGQAFIEIIREVLRNERDLVIKSVGHHESIGQQLFGTTDMKLLRKCPCPVWLVKPGQMQGYRDILVGLDYEPDNAENEALNQQLLEMSTSQALADLSELHLVHAWRLEHESFLRSPRLSHSEAEVDAMVQEEENTRRAWLQETVGTFCAGLGKETASYLKPQLHLIKGDAQDVVPECAQQLAADLVIVGTVGRTGIPGFIIGNTSEAILNRIDCSVLAIKPAGFVSPVTLAD